ncbi:hypothetical protein C2869_02740 [Saccharobesus litoralis]|uniref:HDOD domain-containing protein n=1 Tax=Saccharobesus litoralis TaxID=2172099 RepID=A0A2S0VMH5_9ALTE|nr:HDOD domain-containing protein [Saccharobesus litoralis]AWB65418.1 hypothetical protein C2869_02740 [Saccharobesus litoralis]
MIDIDDKVIKDISKGFQIPAKPEILTELNDIIKSPEPDLNAIGELIAQDVATSAAILKTINSPFYGLARSISDIRQAVMFLGLDGVQALVTAIQLRQAFDQSKCCISLERFWDSASEVAQIATFIAQKFKSQVALETVYTLGLFQDCGIPALATNYSDYKRILVESNKNYELSPTELEEQAYKTNHAVIGYYLATSWHLPKDICQLVLRSHDRQYLESEQDERLQICYSAVKMAENIISTNKRFIASPDWPHIKHHVLEVVDIEEDEYQDIKDDVEELLEDWD